MGDDQGIRRFLSRRAFVGLAGRGAVMVGLGGIIRSLRQGTRIYRPPGARAEEEFLSLCIRCDRCWWACPYSLITPVLITEDVVSAGTPKLKRSICPNCRRCIPACPTGALTPSRY